MSEKITSVKRLTAKDAYAQTLKNGETFDQALLDIVLDSIYTEINTEIEKKKLIFEIENCYLIEEKITDSQVNLLLQGISKSLLSNGYILKYIKSERLSNTNVKICYALSWNLAIKYIESPLDKTIDFLKTQSKLEMIASNEEKFTTILNNFNYSEQSIKLFTDWISKQGTEPAKIKLLTEQDVKDYMFKNHGIALVSANTNQIKDIIDTEMLLKKTIVIEQSIYLSFFMWLSSQGKK